LIRSGAAKNAFIGIEHLTEAEVEEFRALCARAKESKQGASEKRQKAVA
ncbi:low affinity iron permease family protein, partial [Mesorhizobium sp. M00.F.Ca.ET.149.01.1.1]